MATAAVEPELRGRLVVDSVTYDPPGTDSASNVHLNREVVTITNNSARARSLTGWTLRDEGSERVYRFGRTRLRPNRNVIVHTGKGGDRGGHRYWDHDFYVWNSTGDRATLRNRAGRLIDECSCDDGDGRTTC